MAEASPTVNDSSTAAFDASDLARSIVFAIEDRKGENIVMVDLREVTPLADYFVIATADNERQLRALTRAVEEQVRESYQMKPSHAEGNPESGWVLLDYNWVMVHIFSRAQRDYYRLEELWDDAPVVLRIQ